jgi:UDP-N-acetylglucosamine/UDP-N-acetylgalactosamine diphosphorylase
MSAPPAIAPPVDRLLRRGVRMPSPGTVFVDEAVDPERIATDVTVHPGCRILGAETAIGPGCEIGAEAPATVQDCQLGSGVRLKGGFFSGSTFLDGVTVGSSAHVRPGCLLEEHSKAAHAVGLKQTVFLPFVTTGSLVNFCDALVAGGRGREDYTEIGSSYIHFNFTPHRDKATPSLVGDVPRGVMLDQPASFLGGQGGLVGPLRLGTVIPAGAVLRHDVPADGQLVRPPAGPAGDPRPYEPGAYGAIDRLVANNLNYIGNLQALAAWYRWVRGRFLQDGAFTQACFQGALARLDFLVRERVAHLAAVAAAMPRSIALGAAGTARPLPPATAARQRRLHQCWPQIEEGIGTVAGDQSLGRVERERFLAEVDRLPGATPYLEAIAGLPPAAKQAGTAWLQAIVDATTRLWDRDGAGRGA